MHGTWIGDSGKLYYLIDGRMVEQTWLDWLFCAEQAVCKHESMVCDSSIGPDSGSEDFYCPQCGFSDRVVWY
jgi:hypothetical protein